MNHRGIPEHEGDRVFVTNDMFEAPAEPPWPVWKTLVAVAAVVAMTPFMAMAIGITVVLLAPFAIPVLPIIAVTLFVKERPAVVSVGPKRVRARRLAPA